MLADEQESNCLVGLGCELVSGQKNKGRGTLLFSGSKVGADSFDVLANLLDLAFKVAGLRTLLLLTVRRGRER